MTQHYSDKKIWTQRISCVTRFFLLIESMLQIDKALDEQTFYEQTEDTLLKTYQISSQKTEKRT